MTKEQLQIMCERNNTINKIIMYCLEAQAIDDLTKSIERGLFKN